jgi:hypothetical protein
MAMRWTSLVVAAVALLCAAATEAGAQGDRFLGVRKDNANEVILFAIDALSGSERKIATLQPAEANVQLLGLTTLNARRGTFSYAYVDRAAGKEFLHTVSIINGQTVSRIPLPADVSGIEAVPDTGPSMEARAETDSVKRKMDSLEQEVRRLQSQVNNLRSRDCRGGGC